ncbi:MAG TPA: MGMT family protein [Candidatus Acidoferrales bacterium]|nr:MGMT family protein [Candidatus Acidoferrales bacterium]
MRAPRTFQRILDEVRAIPPGHTASYADVAELAIGSRRAARTVGWALVSCPADVPWWRVVRATGELPGVNDRTQTRHLRAEGVVVCRRHASGSMRPVFLIGMDGRRREGSIRPGSPLATERTP